ncbi:MAG: PIF1 family DEAD/DEAH box helicase [bacterium]|nr:PIF1 family DEAD/DEAH box helicase [bacterium]
MKQNLALEIMLSGENVFLTGAAGSGKTFTLNQFIRFAKNEGKKVSVTATTGLAATHLGGNTIHAWSGIGINDYLPNKFVERLSKARAEIIKSTDILIIDEISMLHDFRLDLIDQICRTVRQNFEKPFGGIQVIFSGDFFQLPPINRAGGREGGFAVHSDVWREMKPIICYLDENYRQNDDDLTEILNAMRSDDLRRRHAEKLLARIDEKPENAENLTELHTTNLDVDSINLEKLELLEGEEFFFAQSTTGAKNYVSTLQKSVLAPEILRLKRGALVMAVKNAQNRQYVNGSIGEVIDFEGGTEYPIVKFQNGRTVVMVPETWEMRDGDKKRASISQIPLRLAYAITVHKSQGMTLDSARIDLRKAFAPGMGYVALSRVRSLSQIYLAGINKTALRMSEEAQNIDEYLRKQSSKAEQDFSFLTDNFEKRQISANLSKNENAKSKWAERLEKMRENYPNAYKPWRSQDDADLKQGFLQGESLEELSQKLGRHQNSIKIRLKKHFGEDFIEL